MNHQRTYANLHIMCSVSVVVHMYIIRNIKHGTQRIFFKGDSSVKLQLNIDYLLFVLKNICNALSFLKAYVNRVLWTQYNIKHWFNIVRRLITIQTIVTQYIHDDRFHLCHCELLTYYTNNVFNEYKLLNLFLTNTISRSR
jgi:hypothetical protein